MHSSSFNGLSLVALLGVQAHPLAALLLHLLEMEPKAIPAVVSDQIHQDSTVIWKESRLHQD